MSTLPKQVVVGHRTWKIRRYPKRKADKHNRQGLCEYETSTIYILTAGQTGSEMANTLLHEIGHAIWDEAKLRPKHGEEHIVSLTANLMTQVIRDNPDVFDWIAEKARS